MNTKYPALSFIATAYRIIAVLLGIIGIFLTAWVGMQGGLFMWRFGNDTLQLLLFVLFGLIVSALIALPLYAIGDFFLCITDIEANTRLGADSYSDSPDEKT